MARSEIDTTQPFQSVKEAVAVFGERILSTNSSSFNTNPIIKTKSDASPKPSPPSPAVAPPSPVNKPMYSALSSPRSFSSSVSDTNNGDKEKETEQIVLDYLKKLELEVAETKQEVLVLKKRESEMELALASLNAQLNKNLSRLNEIESANGEEEISEVLEGRASKVQSNRWEEADVASQGYYEFLPSLGEALKFGDMIGDEFGAVKRKRKVQKKKPIIPLVGDIIFSKKKRSSDRNSLYSESLYSLFS